MRESAGKKDMINIGYVVSSLGYGGVENYVVSLANNLNRQRFKPFIISLSNNIPLASALVDDVKVFTLDRKNGQDISLIKKISQIIKDEGIQILHSNNWSTFAESALTKMVSKDTVLLHAQHGMEKNEDETKGKRFVRNRIRQLCSWYTDKIITVSRATKTFVNKEWYIPERKIELIYNGIDPKKYVKKWHYRKTLSKDFKLEHADLVIGSVGRLMPVKNYPMLIKAFHSCYKKHAHLKLLFVGDGPEKGNLQKLVSNFGIEDQVIFAGQCSNVEQVLNCMDIFVLPSFSEGVSLALLEAMATGLPIVATAVGGNIEVIEHKVNGVLVSSDNEKELSRALLELIDFSQLRNKLEQNGIKTINEIFSMDTMINCYESNYQAICKNK